MKLFWLVMSVFSSLFNFSSQAKVSTDEAFLKKLTNISSASENRKGVNRVQDLISAELKRIGFKVETIRNPKGKHKTGKLVVGTFAGKSTQFITFVTHADTVFSRKSKFLRYQNNKDGTATGPGVIDDKGGIVIALRGIEKFLKTNPNPKYSFRFVSSPSEETGSPGFLDLFREFGKNSAAVLGFEPALGSKNIIESRRGNRWYKINVEGKEVHAGRNHKNGINACHELSMKIDQIQKFTNYDKNVTVSIGHISGGKNKFNIICGHAEAKIDTRFSTITDRDELHQKIESVLNKKLVSTFDQKAFAKTSFSIADDCPPFSKTPQSEPYLKKVIDLVKKHEGIDIEAGKSGGAADSNYMSREGLIVIDGLGAVGDHTHSKKEYIVLSSLETRSNVLKDLLTFFEEKGFQN